MEELQELGLISAQELAEVVAMEFNPVRVGFHQGHEVGGWVRGGATAVRAAAARAAAAGVGVVGMRCTSTASPAAARMLGRWSTSSASMQELCCLTSLAQQVTQHCVPACSDMLACVLALQVWTRDVLNLGVSGGSTAVRCGAGTHPKLARVMRMAAVAARAGCTVLTLHCLALLFGLEARPCHSRWCLRPG
jgi:hypothetical protein